MEIISLTEQSFHSNQIARWHYDEWVDPLSETTVDAVARKIGKNVALLREIPHYYIAVDGQKLQGVVELKYRENIEYPEYVHWLGGLYVCSSSREKGVASKLVKFAIKRADELEIDKLYLQCERGLLEFYYKHGFKPLHDATHGKYETKVMEYEFYNSSRT